MRVEGPRRLHRELFAPSHRFKLFAGVWPLPLTALATALSVSLTTTAQADFDVPEPMVFDLVRGLDPAAGELEVNALALYAPTRPQQIDWAPEIEWAFVRGWAAEFELPMHNLRPEALKVALQASPAIPPQRRWAHGAQLLSEYEFDDRELKITPLYLLGLELCNAWSAMLMAGPLVIVPLDGQGGPRDPEPGGGPIDDIDDFSKVTAGGILNATVFYELSEHWHLGSETDFEFFASSVHFRWMPQLHVGVSKKLSLQMGAGLTYGSRQEKPLEPELGLRFIYTH